MAGDATAQRRFYLVLILVLLLGVLLIRYRVDLAVPYGWELKPQPWHPYPLTGLLPALAFGLLCGGAILWLIRGNQPLSRTRLALAVTLAGLLLFGLQIGCEWGPGRDNWLKNMLAATWSTLSNGYFWKAVQIGEVGGFLRDYHTIQGADPMKLGTHPPGAVLVYWLPLQIYWHVPLLQPLCEWLFGIFSRGDTVGVYLAAMEPPNVPRELGVAMIPPTIFCVLFVAALGASAVIPTWFLGASAGDSRTGVLAALLLALMPNSLFYYLSLDIVLMALIAWSLAGVVYATRGDRLLRLPAFGAGVALGLALLISLGAAAGVALALGYLAVCAWRDPARRKPAVAAAALLAAGLALLLLGSALTGLKTWTVYTQALVAHREGGGGIGHRAYLPWLAFNLIDYIALAGIPVVWVAVEAVARGELPSGSARCLGLAFLAVMLVLNVSGTVKGETERIWIFFNPLLAASAAGAARARGGYAWPLACQPLQLLLLALALPPLVRPY